MTTSLKLSQSPATSITCSLLGVTANWLWSHAAKVCVGQVPSPSPSSNQLPSADVDLGMGILSMCEECEAAHISDIAHDNRHLEWPP